MTDITKKRLYKDLQNIINDNYEGITASPAEDDIMKWDAIIIGPPDTPWDGGIFNLKMDFPDDYPNHPPHVVFTTKMFHPNIFVDGNICIDILKNNWSPIYNVAAILKSIQSLLSDPNPLSPANPEASTMYTDNRAEYNRVVSELVKKTWEDDDAEEEGQENKS